MRGNSRLGVGGLSEAVRRGRVRVVNGLGSGRAREPRTAAVHGRHLPARSSASSCGFRPCRPGGAATPRAATPCSTRLGETRRLHRAPHRRAAQRLGGALARRAAPPDPRRAPPLRRPGPPAALAGAGVVERRDERMPTPSSCAPSRVRYRLGVPPARRRPRDRHGARARRPITKDIWVVKGAPEDPDQGLVDVAPLDFRPSIPALAPRSLEDMYWAGPLRRTRRGPAATAADRRRAHRRARGAHRVGARRRGTGAARRARTPRRAVAPTSPRPSSAPCCSTRRARVGGLRARAPARRARGRPRPAVERHLAGLLAHRSRQEGPAELGALAPHHRVGRPHADRPCCRCRASRRA